jgi:hypothetical protein
MDDIKKILCGKCHVVPERGFEREGETWAACAICGQEDRTNDIFRDASEYCVRKGMDGFMSSLGGGSVTVKGPPKRDYRWVVAD